MWRWMSLSSLSNAVRDANKTEKILEGIVGSGSLLRIFSLSYTASLLYKYLDRIAQFYFLIHSQATSSYTLLRRCIIKIPVTNPDSLSITVPFDETVLHQRQRKIHLSCSDCAYHGCSLSFHQFYQSPKSQLPICLSTRTQSIFR